MERQQVGRMTRTLNMVAKKTPYIDYLGTVGEWNQGRREKVLNEHRERQWIEECQKRARKGLQPLPRPQLLVPKISVPVIQNTAGGGGASSRLLYFNSDASANMIHYSTSKFNPRYLRSESCRFHQQLQELQTSNIEVPPRHFQ